jgi:hypothetical protein
MRKKISPAVERHFLKCGEPERQYNLCQKTEISGAEEGVLILLTMRRGGAGLFSSYFIDPMKIGSGFSQRLSVFLKYSRGRQHDKILQHSICVEQYIFIS